MQESNARVRNIRSMPFCWVHRALFDLGLSWKAIITYTALAYEFTGDTPREVPIKRLAAIVNVSEDTIKRGMKELEEKKAIVVKKRFKNKNGKRQQLPNEYILTDLQSPENPI